jgi:hypothetical protein
MGKETKKELVRKPNDDGIAESGYMKPPDKVTPPTPKPPPAPPPKPTEPKKTDK